MKILIFTDGIYPYTIGGMQKHSYYLGKFLARLGVDIDIIIPRQKKNPEKRAENFLTDIEMKHISFIEVDFPRARYFPGHYVYDSYRYSENILQKTEGTLTDYDYIYSQGYTAWALLKKRKNNRPPIGVNFHGVEMYQPSDGFRSHLKKLLLRPPAKYCLKNADVVYSLGGKLTELLNRVTGKDHIVETSIGIEGNWLDNPNFSTTGTRRFVFVGRYEKRKGIELLNNVIQKNKDADFTFEFIGPIPDNKQVSHPAVTYHGAVYEEERIIEILDRSDVLFCPSYSEGMPTVILEAMSRGLAVAATDVGAVSCLVSDKTGWLMEAGDVGELNEVFRKAILIKSDDLIEKKKNAHELIKCRYTWEKVAKRNLNVIKELLNSK
ncbi:glycosyltransferase family 4 protein [Rhodohalobacter sp. 8-1]|uniref:glycosyltransferase family 4 protein n=1 Tax=Rhodohalobacter sp. 8-1 TaxID=3131972 RepID=UPI0030ED5FD5